LSDEDEKLFANAIVGLAPLLLDQPVRDYSINLININYIFFHFQQLKDENLNSALVLKKKSQGHDKRGLKFIFFNQKLRITVLLFIQIGVEIAEKRLLIS